MLLSTAPLILVKPYLVFVLVAALALMLALHLILSRTTFGYALRAVAENPSLAQVNGVNLNRTIMAVWLIGGGLAAVAGIFYGISHQLIPVMGPDLVLPIFAATIIGGIGSAYGAVLGGYGPFYPLALLGGMAAAGIMAWVVGLLTLRLRHDYLAIATFGVAVAFENLIRNAVWLGGAAKACAGLSGLCARHWAMASCTTSSSLPLSCRS